MTAQLPVDNIDVWDLLTAFHRIQIAIGLRVPVQVMMEERPVSAYMDEIRSKLGGQNNRTACFEDLFVGVYTRDEAIGYFLALLELAKQYEIVVTQEELATPILVTLRDEEETRRLQELEARDIEPDIERATQQLLTGEGQEAAAAFDDKDGRDGEDSSIPQDEPAPTPEIET